jgi:hypothetical protein
MEIDTIRLLQYNPTTLGLACELLFQTGLFFLMKNPTNVSLVCHIVLKAIYKSLPVFRQEDE